MEADVAVLGAGVVGLACAERLTRAGRTVVLVERHAGPGRETSSRNSEVVHAGMYYPTGSLKAELCVAGNRSLVAWCEAHRVPHARLGKFIVGSGPEEEAALAVLLARGRANGVSELVPVTLAKLASEEPHVIASAALLSARTGIVDSHALMQSLLEAARSQGADVAFRHVLRTVRRTPAGFLLGLADPEGLEVTAEVGAVVNAAGLRADEVAALAGIDVAAAGYRQTYVKGRYVRVRRRLVRRLVYPIPNPGLTGLGVHVTIQLDGAMRLGPDVEVLPDRSVDYRVPDSVLPAFQAAAARYLRDLTLEDLSPDQAGIRPKLSVSPGQVADFVIQEETARGLPGWVNLVGIESPGLTCCLEIAGRVRELLSSV